MHFYIQTVEMQVAVFVLFELQCFRQGDNISPFIVSKKLQAAPTINIHHKAAFVLESLIGATVYFWWPSSLSLEWLTIIGLVSTSL